MTWVSEVLTWVLTWVLSEAFSFQVTFNLEAHLEPNQIFIMEIFCENCLRVNWNGWIFSLMFLLIIFFLINIIEYTPNKESKMLIVVDNMIANMKAELPYSY